MVHIAFINIISFLVALMYFFFHIDMLYEWLLSNIYIADEK